MREASTEEPALDLSLPSGRLSLSLGVLVHAKHFLLSWCFPSIRFSLTHFPPFSLGYIRLLCYGTSSRKPSLNLWAGSVLPQSMAPVFPSVLQ